MIFHLDTSITEQSQEDILTFAQALLLACENHHFVVRNDVCNWLDSTIMDSPLYLGKLAKLKLQHNYDLFYPKGSHKKRLRELTVGYGDGMITIDQMYRMVQLPSYLILENSKYDWSVFEKWIHLYKDEGEFETINQLVSLATYEGRILPDNGGGKENIPNAAYSRTSLYPESPLNLYGMKMLAIMDSDKESVNDSDKNQKIKDRLDRLCINYYELRKRKIENYFPFDTYRDTELTTTDQRPIGITESDWDYLDLNEEKSERTNLKKIEKTSIIDLSNNLTKKQLKQRIAHDSLIDGHDEVQEVILRLAKLI